MNYSLEFKPKALKEWKKLDHSIKLQFHKKLKERLENPHVPHSKLSGFKNVYKIKLRRSGFRLVYEVIDDRVVVFVLAVGKREDGAVYSDLEKRMEKR
ncbi:type II toxin-antitoxin system RelE family toxin [Nitratifractor sp.]